MVEANKEVKVDKKDEKEVKQEIPKEMQDKEIKTEVVSFKKMLNDTLQNIKDYGTLEIKMDVFTRMRNRLRKIKEESSAENIKVKGYWHTLPPKFHIQNLKGKKINNDEVEITFSVFKMDGEGNKKPFFSTAKGERADGTIHTVTMSADYHIAYEVREIIKTNKPIQREIMKFERPDEV